MWKSSFKKSKKRKEVEGVKMRSPPGFLGAGGLVGLNVQAVAILASGCGAVG